MKKVQFSLLLVFILLLFSEGVLRLWVADQTGISLIRMHHLPYKYYPELHGISVRKLDLDQINILLLGASVMEDVRGDVRSKLERSLQANTEKKVNVYNLSKPAHSSRDSRTKMELLGKRPYDLVIFYHSINELRANCCPKEIFKTDYSHYSWYKETRLMLRHPEIGLTVIPYCLDYLFEVISGEGMDPGKIKNEWEPHCADFKSKESYQKNVEAIVGLSERLLLVNYAIHIPEKYDSSMLDSFYTHTQFRSVPVELFGHPPVLASGIATHNAVLEAIVKNNTSCFGLPMDRLLTRSKANFNDVCHLTEAGAIEFVSYLGPKVAGILEER